jgi:glucose-1-phosphate adenylyltransferase
MPLTLDRAKPAVPFAGRYRLIDFAMSNLLNSGFAKIVVLTQYKSQSMQWHLSRAFRLSRVLDQYVETVPAQQRTGIDWYKGSADAIYQNLNLIYDEMPADVIVFGADHIYKMHVGQMLEFHRDSGAALTISAVRVPVEEASSFGVIEVDEKLRIIGFEEKPKKPKTIPGDPDHALCSMGNYIFQRDALIDRLLADARSETSVHDFGRDIIPAMLADGDALYAYDFNTNSVPGVGTSERGYWRDVGTIQSYFQASMDLIAVQPVVDLYNRAWPIRTNNENDPPVKFVHAEGDRTGLAIESLVCDGCIISGGQTWRSLLSPRVRVNSYSHIEESVLFHNVRVGRYARIRRTIVDKHVVIPPGIAIGYDHELDRSRGLTVTPEGITVVPKGTVFEE